ncbi:aldehyde dehydrogenase family protein [Streptomyces sp. NBC_00063]
MPRSGQHRRHHRRLSGWFVDPTLLEVDDPHSPFMTEEQFAPVTAAYVYEDTDWEKTLRLVDESTIYGLTGAVFADDETAITQAADALRYTAGNFHINDKPTGAVVGQQPFGGSRTSGTNDKVGTVWNLIRFTSPLTVKRPNIRNVPPSPRPDLVTAPSQTWACEPGLSAVLSSAPTRHSGLGAGGGGRDAGSPGKPGLHARRTRFTHRMPTSTRSPA